jgi:3'-phosphoadenosine 5'-phosphosulfate sulfotransferase (PAPS reductase)/FAD synthetase
VISKPRKPFAQVITEYGKPCLSKLKSEALSTYQNHIDEPLKTARAYQLITGTRLKGGKPIEGRNSYKLANKHMHFIHPSTEFKVANKCCQYMKKYPFQDFEKQNNMNGSFSGVRVSEGGARSMAYDSCVKIKRKGDKEEFVMSMPIIDWTDRMIDEFIEKFEVKLSDAYEVYGCTRTGCCACPYSQNLSEELRLLHNFEPLKYRAMMHWMKDVYMYQLIECSYDEQYSAEYAVRKKEIEQRRSEMMNKFRPKIK